MPCYDTIHMHCQGITPCTLHRLGLPAWGFAQPSPGKHGHGCHVLNQKCQLPTRERAGVGWERVVWLLTLTVTAIVVGTALRDPLGRSTAPLAASFQRPPGREVSSEAVPRGGWPGRPQQGVAVEQKSVSQQLVSVIVAALGFPLQGNRQNTEFATLVTDVSL